MDLLVVPKKALELFLSYLNWGFSGDWQVLVAWAVGLFVCVVATSLLLKSKLAPKLLGVLSLIISLIYGFGQWRQAMSMNGGEYYGGVILTTIIFLLAFVTIGWLLSYITVILSFIPGILYFVPTAIILSLIYLIGGIATIFVHPNLIWSQAIPWILEGLAFAILILAFFSFTLRYKLCSFGQCRWWERIQRLRR